MTDRPIFRRADIAAAHHIGLPLGQLIEAAKALGFVVREIPIGLAIASPFDWFTGEKMIFYARIRGPQLRFEDNGSTIFELEGAGVDFSSSTRATSLQELCDEAGVVWDDDESMFYTNWFDPEEVGLKAIKFMGFMLRVQDKVEHWCSPSRADRA